MLTQALQEASVVDVTLVVRRCLLDGIYGNRLSGVAISCLGILMSGLINWCGVIIVIEESMERPEMCGVRLSLSDSSSVTHRRCYTPLHQRDSLPHLGYIRHEM